MKKIKQEMLLILILFVAVILVSSLILPAKAIISTDNTLLSANNEVSSDANLTNHITTQVNDSVADDSILPDFVWEATVRMNPNASSAELSFIREQTIKQLEFNQKRIADTNGEVQNYPYDKKSSYTNKQNLYSEYSEESVYVGDYWMYALSWSEESQYGGSVEGDTNIIGYSNDEYFTRFYTPGFTYEHGQMASIAGQIWPSHAIGDVYVVAKLGPMVGHEPNSTNGNYIIVWTANTPSQDINHFLEYWTPIGYLHITEPYVSEHSPGALYYVGTAHSHFEYISVGAMTGYGGIDTYNDVEVDCVLVANPLPSQEAHNVVVWGSNWAEPLEREFPIAADFYVDSNFAGFTMYDSLGLNLSPGNHTIEIVPSYGGLFHDVLITNDYGNWTLSENPISINIESGVSYNVQFRYGFSCSASASAGGTVTPQYQTGLHGDTLQITANPDQSYRLAYWTINGEYGGEDNPLNITLDNDNVNVVAYFEVSDWDLLDIQSTVGGTAYVVNGTFWFPNATLATVNVNSVLDGFAFSNWTINGNYASSSQLYTFTIVDNCTVTAHFTETSPHHYLTVQYTSGGTAWSSSSIYLVGAQATIYASADVHYNFTGWTVNGNFAGCNNTLTITMNDDYVVVGHFEFLPLVSFVAGYGGSPYLFTPISVPFYVDGIYIGDSTVNDFALCLGNHSLQVPSVIYGGDGYWYFFNCFYTVQGQYYPFSFTYYYDNPAVVNVSSDETYHALYDEVYLSTSTLMVVCSEGGHVTVEGGLEFTSDCYAVETDNYLTVTPVADAGYVFSGWVLNGWPIGNDNPLNLYMNNDYTLYAIFTQN
jgi:hypothetical protein